MTNRAQLDQERLAPQMAIVALQLSSAASEPDIAAAGWAPGRI